MTDVDRPDDVEEYGVGDTAEGSKDHQFRYAPAAGATPLLENREGSDPIPAFPLHVCPTCDHTLTGLTSRRCPDCGKAFTLADARKRGSDKSEEGRQDYRAIRHARIRVALGLFLLNSSYVGALFIGTTDLSVRTWIVSTIFGTMSVTVLMYKVFFQKPWSHALSIAGILAVVLATLIVLI